MSSIQRSGSFEKIEWEMLLGKIEETSSINASTHSELINLVSMQKFQSINYPVISPNSSDAPSEPTVQEQSISLNQKRFVPGEFSDSKAKRTKTIQDEEIKKINTIQSRNTIVKERDAVAQRIVELSLFWSGRRELPHRYQYELQPAQNPSQTVEGVGQSDVRQTFEDIDQISIIPELFDL